MNSLRGLIQRSIVRTNLTHRSGFRKLSSLSACQRQFKNHKIIGSVLKSIYSPVSVQKRFIHTPINEQGTSPVVKKLDIDMLSALGIELIGQSRYEDAIEVYERLFARPKEIPAEQFSNIFQTLTNLYERAGRRDAALEILSKFIEIREGRSAADLMNRARDYASKKQYDKEYTTLYTLATMLAEHMTDPLCKVFKAKIDDDHAKIIEIVEKIHENEIVPQMWDYFAQAQMHFGKHEEALKSLEKALANSPGEEWAELRRSFMNTKIQALIRLGKLEEAMNATEEQDHDHFTSFRSLGEIAYASGEFEDALESYDAAIEMHEQVPTDVFRFKSYLLKATALDAKGDLQEAIKAYEYVLSIKPDEQVSMERLAALYLDVDNIGGAKKMLEKLMELRPNDQKLISKMDYVQARLNSERNNTSNNK